MNQGDTPSAFTGPSVDQTTEHNTSYSVVHVPSQSEGYYIYIESTWTRLEGDKACLESPAINATATPGMTFWRHMYGLHVGTLNVYANTSHNASDDGLLFSTSGSEGDRWIWTHICLSDFGLTGMQAVRFEGVVGVDFSGDIAIDDVHFGDCLVTPPPSPPPPPPPPSPPSPPPPPPPPCESPTEYHILQDGDICDQTDPSVYGVCDPCGTESRGPLDCVCVSSYIRRKRRTTAHASMHKRELLFGGVPGGEDFCYCQEVGG